MKAFAPDLMDGSSDGFTLLEVLIGIALSTMLLLLLSDVAFFANMSVSDVREAAKRHQSSMLFRGRLTQSLAVAYPYNTQDSSKNERGPFEGGEQIVEFSVYSNAVPRVLVELRIGSDGLALRENERTSMILATADFFWRDVASDQLCLRYYGAQSSLEQPAWSKMWAAGGLMPKLLAVTNQCEEPRVAPVATYRWEYFSLPVTVSGSCEFDELLQRCRGSI